MADTRLSKSLNLQKLKANASSASKRANSRLQTSIATS
jgi:hypothetical protein